MFVFYTEKVLRNCGYAAGNVLRWPMKATSYMWETVAQPLPYMLSHPNVRGLIEYEAIFTPLIRERNLVGECKDFESLHYHAPKLQL